MFAKTQGQVLYIIIFVLYSYQPTTKVSCTNIYKMYTVEEKQKYHITFFCDKTKVSYYIKFFQTLQKMFSCGLCHSYGRIIFILLREKESKLCLEEEQKGDYIILSMNKCRVTNIYTVEKNKSIILHSFAKKNKSIIIITSHSSKLS